VRGEILVDHLGGRHACGWQRAFALYLVCAVTAACADGRRPAGPPAAPATAAPSACTFSDVTLDDLLASQRCSIPVDPRAPLDVAPVVLEVHPQVLTLREGERSSVEVRATNPGNATRRVQLDVRCGTSASDWIEVAIVHLRPRQSSAPPNPPGTTIRMGADERADLVFHNYACPGGIGCTNRSIQLWLAPKGVLRVRTPIAAQVVDTCEHTSSPLAQGRYTARLEPRLFGPGRPLTVDLRVTHASP
jgi:hypothetical protein